MKKFLKTVSVWALLLAVLTSCGKNTGAKTLPVLSTYPHLDALEAGEYTYDKTHLLEDGDYPYRFYDCVVSVAFDQLVVTHKLDYHNAVYGTSRVMRAGDYWGDDTGIFRQDANGDNMVVSTETLVGFLHFYTEDQLVAISGGVNGGTLHLIDHNEAEKHEKRSFEGTPMAFSYTYTDKNYDPPKYFYIATDRALLYVDMEAFLNAKMPSLASVKITALAVPSYWEYLNVNSMCELNGVLYMGSQMGVLAYDLEKGVYTYYPVEYETVIDGK